jgi:hypothetical protein
MERKNRRESISIMSGWGTSCAVHFYYRVPAPEIFRTKTYKPGRASTERLANLINWHLKQNNRLDVSITMMGNTLFFDIDV